VYGPWAWGHDSGETTAALMKFPNAVAFSGHSHYSLTDDRSIWQGGFTSLGTASLRGCATPGDELHPDSGYENAWGGLNAFKAMRPIGETSRQGMLVRVFDDCIAFTRRDFSIDKMLGGDWVMPLPIERARCPQRAACESPFSFAARLAKEKPPAFPAGAALVVSKTEATNRGGRAKIDGVKKDIPQEKKVAVRLDFPRADAMRSTRTFFYEATFTPESGKAVVKRMLAPGVFKPDDEFWSAKDALSMTVCLDQLPPEPFKVEVRAISALGSRSAPLAATI
jgi:hypothetical protein